MKQGATIEVDGKQVAVSNLQKVLYPSTGFTKGDLINYYIQIAPHLLPHLKDRPITLKRYPDGVEGSFFYEKRCPSHRPKWVKTASVPKSDGADICYCVLSGLPSLVWAANLANLELHTFLHRAPAIKRPTMVAFDLDPGPPADIVLCCEVGLVLRDLFERLGLQCFPKTSGSKGLQVYVPLNTPTDYDKTKAFAHSVAQSLEREIPEKVVADMKKSARHGKVLVDWSQNDDHKTTVTVYSLRAQGTPTVSTPLEWEEVARASKRNDPRLVKFDSATVLKRVEKRGDIFAPVLTLKQKLPSILK